MSSSRILKSGSSRSGEPRHFRFDSLEVERAEPFCEECDGFIPLFAEPLFAGAGQEMATAEDHAVEALPGVDPGEALLRIEEEEFNSRLTEAFERGLEEGRRHGEEALAAVGRTLEETLSEVSRLREKILRECEDDLLKLAILVSKKIIQQEVTHDRRILAQFVGEALRSVEKQEDIVICLNPEDCRVVTSNREFYLGGLEEDGRVVIKSDEGTPPGGCVVETANGIVDARIEAQLDFVYRRLVEERCTLTMTAGHRPPETVEVTAEVISQ